MINIVLLQNLNKRICALRRRIFSMLLGRHINKYYIKFWWLYLIGVIGLVAVDYFQTLIPEYLGSLVDLFDNVESVSSIDMSLLKEIIIGVIVVGVVMFAGRIVWRLSLLNASQKTEAGMRHDMFLKSEKLSQRYFHETKVGTIMAWFTNDLETIEEYLSWGTVMLFDAVFLSLLVIVKMVMLDWFLSIILFIPLALIVVWGALVEKFMANKWDARQKAFDKLYDFSQESFTGIRVIKAFVKETQQLHQFASVAGKNKDTTIDFVKTSVLFDVLIYVIIAVITAILLGLGGFFVYRFVTDAPVHIGSHTVNLSAGQLITFVGFFDTLVWPMMAMGQIVSMRSRAKASLKRVSNFLDAEEDIKSPENAIMLDNVKGEVKFDHFSFAYPNCKENVLKDVSIVIEPGQTIGVVGKIGCGKTTLVNSLLRLYNLEKGCVFIDGTDLMDCDIESVRNAVAYVPQDNFLFSETVKNNIAFSNENASLESVKDAAEFACVDNDIEGFADKYETMTGERGVTLSGGQKQRISIARAYIKDAPILILDDSVSAVDVRTEETVLKNIAEKRKGKTTIVVASRVSTVSHMDKILVLNDGCVEAFDNAQNLQNISPTYQKMVYLQALEREVEGGNTHE